MTGVWSAHVTKEGRTYYYNRNTKQSAWEKPAEFDGEEPCNSGSTLSSKKAEWEELWDPKNERAYYYNRTTRKTQWQRPEGVEIKPHNAPIEKHKHHKSKKNEQMMKEEGHLSETLTPSLETSTLKQEEKQDESMILSKKKKKKHKREKVEHVEVENQAKRRRQDEKRLIIWDDENQETEVVKNIEEKDTEDGKEATKLLQELSKTDAIMESNVLAVINGFLRAHTESNGPELLVEKLSSSYRGHAQMIGLVASWLDLLPVSTTVLEKKMTFDVNEGAVIANKGASWDPAEEILYRHIKDIVNENYDPKLVSNVLSGSTMEPQWLTQMLSDRKWRLMLIELAETHKTCTLLQYAIRRISEAGHHKEIASITSANAFFPVFNGVLVDAFSRIPFATEEEVVEDLAALKKVCCQSSHSYLYAQELLCSMDDKLYSIQKDMKATSNEYTHIRMVRSKLNRVHSELQETASGRFGAKIVPYHILRRRYIYDKNSEFCDAILSIIKTKKCSELSAQALAKEYQMSKDPPPVAHLRDTMVLSSLLDRLFNPSDLITSAFIQNCVFLLAYAASTKDERSLLQTGVEGSSKQVQVDNESVETTKKALIEASAICKSDHTLGYNMNQSGVVDKLISVMSVPVVSMGVLHWLEVILTSPGFFSSTPLHICFPSLLRILKESIKLHSAQWPIAFGVLVTSLRLHPDINPVKALELKRETLGCMVFMITNGYVLPVLEFIFTNTLELDQALLRNFITMLFVRIAPPYSQKFALALTRILTHPKVQTAIKTCPRESKMKLQGFVTYCAKNSNVLSSDQLQSLIIMQEGKD
ncbi:th1 family protein [Plasmopara halstedii]|uniref:Th1 family protein n=1 Tax=Plasmopara halstedii TaxID=4781 RepID=A0A0P1AW72_PLAHL|nr:th1 family protein [Plasmopara halstedii]CEG45712.1 th1 family protein [Plasmopara halstedii]|eukprot:XP_024582081.1 th1 family protein [Plasmopara halstedii]